jgi:hypothetical protein
MSFLFLVAVVLCSPVVVVVVVVVVRGCSGLSVLVAWAVRLFASVIPTCNVARSGLDILRKAICINPEVSRSNRDQQRLADKMIVAIC